jgi:hypothetical protein
MVRIVKKKGESHPINQPVQHVPVIRDRDGDASPDVHCRIEVICMTDGSPRAIIDDGYGEHGQPNAHRQQAIRMFSHKDEDGDPLFVVREKLRSWESGHLNSKGRYKTFLPIGEGPQDKVTVAVLDKQLERKMRANIAARAAFLADASGTAGDVVREGGAGVIKRDELPGADKKPAKPEEK